MSEENQVPEEVVAEEGTSSDPETIEAAETTVLNKKIAAVVGNYFRAMSAMSDDDIYRLAFTPEGENSPLLLKLVNNAYTTMLAAGGDLPRIHFDSYKRTVESFNQTFVYNLSSKLDANRDTLIAVATGKTENPDRISHQDILDALNK